MHHRAAAVDLPRGLWGVFARLDAQPIAGRWGLAVLLFAAWWTLARGTLLSLGDTGPLMDTHLGVLAAAPVLLLGVLHRRWYLVERPRWWATLRARMVSATGGTEPASNDAHAE